MKTKYNYFSISEKTGYKSLPFWATSCSRATILDFMTFHACSFVIQQKSYCFLIIVATTIYTSYNTKWRREGNQIPKIADICIQHFHTLERFPIYFNEFSV